MERQELHALLQKLADTYETADFINGDPSWFMHQVRGSKNQETIGFLASVLSYGRRELFMPKIQYMLDCSDGEVFHWVAEEKYKDDISDNKKSYYRLYNNHAMTELLNALRELINEYGSISSFIKHNSPQHSAIEALSALGDWFLDRGIKGMVSSPKTSVAKRPCMYLRWMVRDNSPVDLGLWSDFIDKRTLYIPMDTHVMQEAQKLELIHSKSASWHTVEQLTDSLREVFPYDPTKGDFALFGYGVNNSTHQGEVR